MRFALLGVDADALEVAHFVVRSGTHQLVLACDVGAGAAAVREIAPDAQISPHWESLLASGTADAVIVARGVNPEERADQLRKLVQERVPLLLSHPVSDSMLVCYELDMIRRETGCPIVPYVPCRWHPAVARLAAMISQGPDAAIGAAEQLIMERAMPERTRQTVERQFARDVELLRALAGDLTSVSALAPGGKEAAVYSNLGVQLTGPSGLLVRWSVGPVEHAASATLTVRGSAGKATLGIPDAGQPTELVWTGARSDRESFLAWEPAGAAVERLDAAIGKQPSLPTWTDACRDVELAEAIHRSLAKGRTIELHDEEHSEHGTFKGTMASLGCGLLLASLVVLVLAAALAKITGNELFGRAPYLILGLLGVFLLMQLLKLVFPREES